MSDKFIKKLVILLIVLQVSISVKIDSNQQMDIQYEQNFLEKNENQKKILPTIQKNNQNQKQKPLQNKPVQKGDAKSKQNNLNQKQKLEINIPKNKLEIDIKKKVEQKDYFSYDLIKKPQGTCVIQGNGQINGKLWTNQMVARNATINNKMEVRGQMKVNRIKSEGGYFENLYVDQIVAKTRSINIEGDLIITQNFSPETIEASSFVVQDQKQWLLNNHDDFDNKTNIEGWNFNETSHCDDEELSIEDRNYFLGGHCKLSYDEVQKTYENLPKHDEVMINANYHMFDDWNGEIGYMKVNGIIVWEQAGYRSNHTSSINLCGNDYSDPKFAMPISYQFPHKESNIQISFGSTLQKESCRASFAIDNVQIYVK